MAVREMRVLDMTGDKKTTWDADQPDEVEAAREEFEKLTKKGFVGYSVDKKGEKGVLMKKFDPDAERMILAPPVVGG